MFDQNLDSEGFITVPEGSSTFRNVVAYLQRSTGIRPITNEVEEREKFLLRNTPRDADLTKTKVIEFTNGIYPLSDLGLLAAYKNIISAVEHPEGFIYIKVDNTFPRNPLSATYETKAYKKWIRDKRRFTLGQLVPITTFIKDENTTSREELEAMEGIFILEKDEYHIRNGRLYIVGYDMLF